MRVRCLSRAALCAAAISLLVACSAPAQPAATALPPVTPIMIPPAIAAGEDAALAGRVWNWTGTLRPDGRSVTPAAPERYTLEFFTDGRVQLRADCNRGSARYTTGADRSLTLSPAAVTKMGCPRGSDDAEFLRQLAQVGAYRFADGDLVLALHPDAGSMRFAPLAR
jgi:heat shock protein HslJ